MSVDVGSLWLRHLQGTLGSLGEGAQSRWAALESGCPAQPLQTLLAPSGTLLAGLDADPWAALAGPAARPAALPEPVAAAAAAAAGRRPATRRAVADPTPPTDATPGPARPAAGLGVAADAPRPPAWMRAPAGAALAVGADPATVPRAGLAPARRPSRAPDGPRLPPQALPTLVARLAGPDAPAALPTALLRRLAGQALHPVSRAASGGSSAAPDPVAPRPAAAGGAPGARDLAALAAALDPTRRPPPAAATALADPTSEPAGRTARRGPTLPGEAPPAAAPVAWPAAPPPGGRPSALVELLQRWPGAQAGPGQPLASAGAPPTPAAVGNAVGDASGPSPLDRFADPPGLRRAASLSPTPTPTVAAGRHMAVEAAARPRHDDPADAEAAGGDELLFRRRLERVLQAELRRHGIDPGEGG